jgi:acetoin utilization deacetylase AcuC-like enzyme
MATALISHPDCLAHDTGPYHPERSDRLRAILRVLDDPCFAALVRLEAPLAAPDQIGATHPAAYVDEVLNISPAPGRLIALDPDTMVSAGTGQAALRAAGGAIAAVDAVMRGDVRNAFAAVRPPGHHAEPSRAMGFCLFNNVAVATAHARARWGVRRVAVLDFDVHHGNGTQAMFAANADLFYGSSHQHPCYPGTGFPGEHGVANNIVNVQLRPGSDGAAFRAAWTNTVLPSLTNFGPELVVVSAGFDAHRTDPLAQLMVETEDFVWLTEALLAAAATHANHRLISVLEGGYDLEALAASTAAHVQALMRA